MSELLSLVPPVDKLLFTIEELTIEQEEQILDSADSVQMSLWQLAQVD
jgi:hypothetical protein